MPPMVNKDEFGHIGRVYSLETTFFTGHKIRAPNRESGSRRRWRWSGRRNRGRLAAGPAGAPPKQIRASRPGPASAAGPVAAARCPGPPATPESVPPPFSAMARSRPARARIQNQGKITLTARSVTRVAPSSGWGFSRRAVRKPQCHDQKFILRRLQAGEQGIGRGNVRLFPR